MNSDQQSFFDTIDATLTEDGHSHFETDHGQASNFITVIPYYGLLAIYGPDTAKFLQGQTSCDLDKVDDQHSGAGAYCTPKGRVISSFHVGRQDEQHYLLRMHRDIVDSTRDTLAKYMVFSKAEQHNASEQYQVLGLHGAQAASAIEDYFGATPGARWGTVNLDGMLAIQLDDDATTFECWVSNEQAAACWQSLAAQLSPASSRQWALLAIQQGWGEVCAATVDLFIPQMLNYQLTGAVSFTKGCYTGQEVVARMQYRGKLKRRMYRARLEGRSALPGDSLYSEGNEQSIGNVANMAAAGDNSCEILAVITNRDIDAGSAINTATGKTLELLPLPYSVEED